jgi:hypothetical protein
MFSQILIDPVDADFQRILWQPTSESSLHQFRLFIVTYGLVFTPYLVIRILKQLSINDDHSLPATVPIIENSIYIGRYTLR